MSDFVFPLAQSSIGVVGSKSRFPVRRVWCVGRNYLAHVRELGNDERESPLFFSKQPDMLVPGGGAIRYPSQTKNFHYEIELVVALKSGGAQMAIRRLKCVFSDGRAKHTHEAAQKFQPLAHGMGIGTLLGSGKLTCQ